MKTRKDYLDGKCSHAEFYRQFVGPRELSIVAHSIGKDRILASKDEHFNDIPLALWDRISVPVGANAARRLREAGDYPTLGGAVCIMKQAARMLVEGGKE